jgi:hypothetical protein
MQHHQLSLSQNPNATEAQTFQLQDEQFAM